MENEKSSLTVGINQKMSVGELLLFAVQHLMGITFLLAVSGIIGAACGLTSADIGYMVQSCFITAGIVTILQSIFILKLPAVHGPTAVFMSAILTTGAAYGLGTAGTAYYPWVNLLSAVITIVVAAGFMLFGKKGLMKRGALLWAIIVGTIFYAIFGHIDFSSVAQAELVGLPKIMPYGFGVNIGVVILMLLAYLHSVSEALGMYSLIAGWDGQQVDEHRSNGGIFGLAVGNIVGTLVGGCPTTTYPENVGIIRATGVGSRFATLVMGIIAILLGFFPKLGMLIAVIPSPVLNGATVILFGMIAFSGVQHLKDVAWDDMNVITAAVPYIIAIGCMFLPTDFTAMLPSAVQSIVTQPMLVGIILLIILNLLNNTLLRTLFENPLKSIFCSIIFGALMIMRLYIAIPGLNPFIYDMCPYIVTSIVIIITSIRKTGKDHIPESLGENYYREER